MCSPYGRDCIEGAISQDFNCSVTCEGIYADTVHWAVDKTEEEMEDKVSEEDLEMKLKGKVGIELYKEMYKQIKKDLKKEMSTDQIGEALDEKKYMELVSEYNNFKKNNCRHLRFNSAENRTEFGK